MCRRSEVIQTTDRILSGKEQLVIHSKWLTCFCVAAVFAQCGCIRRWARIDLTPVDKRPVYSAAVGDADEAGLLVQEIKIEPVRLDAGRLYFYASNDQLNAMRALGLSFQQNAPQAVSYRVIEVRRTPRRTERELAGTGVLILNREPEFWVVRGTLGQLSALQSARFQIRVLTDEPRPREVKIVVQGVADIHRVTELGIDILSVDPRPGPPSKEPRPAPQRFSIAATAFDYQIDRVKEFGFDVTVTPYPSSPQKGKRP